MFIYISAAINFTCAVACIVFDAVALAVIL